MWMKMLILCLLLSSVWTLGFFMDSTWFRFIEGVGGCLHFADWEEAVSETIFKIVEYKVKSYDNIVCFKKIGFLFFW